MKEFKVVYRIEDCGGSIDLVGVYPQSLEVENLFYKGHLLRNAWVEHNGVFEMKIKVTNNGEFGILSLEKTYG